MPNKSLGQHWLKDRTILGTIVDESGVTETDIVLEIGPGLGTLTSVLLGRASRVIAVEYDELLAKKLPGQFPGKNLQVINHDILTFDLSQLPADYKVVANVPYYITQKIVERFLGADNQPESMTLLVQQEVAEKLGATAGDMSAIAAKLQYTYDVQKGTRVPKEYFTPPPKVDSQVVVCKLRHVDKYVESSKKQYYRVVDAGFSAPRKKLHSSLSGGLGLSKDQVQTLLKSAGVDGNLRAQDLSLDAWQRLSATLKS